MLKAQDELQEQRHLISRNKRKIMESTYCRQRLVAAAGSWQSQQCICHLCGELRDGRQD